ncbi:MAG: hypothetical protein IKR47_02150 [Lachnospiraceae bacterium]|nr:hypothetical protein [Lachnospiraceae bacterium]MCR4685574.1 hypothetical protein [Lachnospiraceae bacterium]
MFSINGYDFQNEEDVDIAREELNKIQYISDKLKDDPESILAVYNKMLDGKIFITPIGIEYLRSLQGYLLRSPEIDDAAVRDVPVLISYQDALHYKDLAEALEMQSKMQTIKRKPEPETPSEKIKRRYKFSLITIVVLSVMIVAMFIIALNSNTPNIINYRTEIENEYADWAQQLTEKEEELRERERALQ